VTALNLFPARIRFVNGDGTLTPEAYRALQIVFSRVGGTLGDSGTDVYASPVNFSDIAQNSNMEMVVQTGTPDAVAAAGSLTFGVATIDFGAFPGSNEASIVVSGQTAILATSKVSVWVMGDDTSVDHTASDHKYLPQFATFVSGTPVASTGFTIYGRSIHKLTGTYTLRWVWSD
jgi:hypothetical protein